MGNISDEPPFELSDVIVNLRKKSRKGGKFALSEEDLIGLDNVMKAETGYDFTRVRSEIDFRVAFLIPKQEPTNQDYSFLTVTTGDRNLCALPGGKIDPARMPFSAFLLAQFLSKNKQAYEDNVFRGQSVPLVEILSSPESVERYVAPLDRFARRMDQCFDDGYSEIRAEGFRELKDELGLSKVSRGKELKVKERANMELTEYKNLNEGINLEDTVLLKKLELDIWKTDGYCKKWLDVKTRKKVREPVYVLGAIPISIFVDKYRVPLKDSEEVAKRWFISCIYLADVRGSYAAVNEYIESHLGISVDEVNGRRWVSFPEILQGSYQGIYHDSVYYAAHRVAADLPYFNSKVRYSSIGNVLPHYGQPRRVVKRMNVPEEIEIILPEPFQKRAGEETSS